jgi:hypothetical protein
LIAWSTITRVRQALEADYERTLEHQESDHHLWVHTRTAITHAVAEELGQRPGRGSVIIVPVAHVLEGVDLEPLK